MRYVNPTSTLQTAASYSLREPSGQNPFSEAEEMELAIELLEVASEAELEQFLDNLFEKAWRGVKPVRSSVIRPLGGMIKTVIKTALPFVATAANTYFGGPAGGAIAGKLGPLVSQALEAEAAGMTAADRDLEKRRQFVRMVEKAARAAALAPIGTNPIALAQKVLTNSAQEKLAKRAAIAGRAGSGTQAATTASPVSIPVETAQTGWGRAETDTAAASGRRCTSCGQSSWICKCGAISQTGRWVRHGRSIVIVNC